MIIAFQNWTNPAALRPCVTSVNRKSGKIVIEINQLRLMHLAWNLDYGKDIIIAFQNRTNPAVLRLRVTSVNRKSYKIAIEINQLRLTHLAWNPDYGKILF